MEQMPVERVIQSRVPVKIWTDQVEPEALRQPRDRPMPIVFRQRRDAGVQLGK